MEIFVKTTEEKENDIRLALVKVLQTLVQYKLEKSEAKIAFLAAERSVQIQVIVPGLNGALRLLEALYNDREDFFQAFAAEMVDELFKQLIFSNRICDVAYYRDLYPWVELTITDYVVGGKFDFTFRME